MIFRITDYVHYGTLDNRKRGTVHLTLQLMGMPHPVNITLHGDCLQDLAGCVVDFRNPSPTDASCGTYPNPGTYPGGGGGI